MRTVLTAALAALLLSAGFVVSGSVDQAEAKQRKKVYYEGYSGNYRYPGRPSYDDNSRWYPNDADQLKIGSRIWYDQMEREGRMGRPRG